MTGARRSHGGAPRGMRDDDDAELGGGDRLGAMRAVWLAMRDEDPPERGMAELLAAARGKAAMMGPRATWWQRVLAGMRHVLAGMRRPPALAFAAVIVLIGGAVVVGGRDGSPAGMGSAPAGMGSAPAGMGSAPAGELRGKLTTPNEPARGTGSQAVAPPAAPGAVHGVTKRSRDGVAVRAPGKAAAGNAESEGFADEAEADAEADAGPSDEAATASSGSTRAQRSPPTSAQAPRRRPGPLYQQCEAAAQRGDCVEVRRLVEQITVADRGYRARIGGGSAVARCLADRPAGAR